MIDYIDPIPPVVRFLNNVMDERVYGNRMPNNSTLPVLVVKSAGGAGYTRLQVIARANDDVTAMQLLIKVVNLLERYGSEIALAGCWIERESNPMPSVDEDTGKPEAWCYLRMEHFEA